MQADSMSRFFSITVTDNGAAWTPPDGAAWTVRFGAPGMPAGWYDTITEPGGGTHPAVVVDENTATVEIAEQAVSTPGTNVLCVLVTDAQGYQIASWPFALNVQGVPGFDAPEATVYYNALTAQVAQVLANAQAAAASATLAESWAVGGTGTRPGEDTNNAEYWAQQAQSIANGQLGWFETEQALEAAHPTGQNGQWAIIGSTDTIWTWDSDTSAWVNSGSTADLSNYYTKTQADAAFATAAQGALAASAVQSVNGKTGTAVTLNASDVGAAPAANGINTYTCTTSSTTHALAGTGNNIKFVADAEYKAGDTITVNGQAVNAQTQDGAALSDGAWASGATVVCWLDGTTLNFKGGGGKGVVDCGWIAWANILASTTFTSAIVPSASKGNNYDFNASANGFSTTYQNNALSVEVTKSGTYAINIFAFRAAGGTAFCQILKNGQPLFNSENTPVFPGYTGDIATSAQIIAQLSQGDVLTLQGRSSSGQDCVVHLSAVAAK